MKFKRLWVVSRFLLVAGLLLVIGSGLLIGCKEGKTLTGIIFNHQMHLGRGYTCSLCHQFLSDDNPERPSERVCVFCHATGDRGQPSLVCAQCHSRIDFFAESLPRLTYGDNKFHHNIHLKRSISCQKCHIDQENAKVYDEIVFPAMPKCIACHSEMTASRECTTCHKDWRKEEKPVDHDLMWPKVHGQEAVERFDNYCEYCHSKKVFCQECHLASPPENHTLFFKNRGHGFWAETDRMYCLPCHKQDFCLRCHGPAGQVQPLTHKGGGWSQKPYMHCTNCHFPNGDTFGCSVCHNTDIIQLKHIEATLMKSNAVPEIVPTVSLNCLNACHPWERVIPQHPIGAMNNNDCIRCHLP